MESYISFQKARVCINCHVTGLALVHSRVKDPRQNESTDGFRYIRDETYYLGGRKWWKISRTLRTKPFYVGRSSIRKVILHLLSILVENEIDDKRWTIDVIPRCRIRQTRVFLVTDIQYNIIHVRTCSLETVWEECHGHRDGNRMKYNQPNQGVYLPVGSWIGFQNADIWLWVCHPRKLLTCEKVVLSDNSIQFNYW